MKKNDFDIIGMAWSDKISFDEIKKKNGLGKKKVIRIIRKKIKEFTEMHLQKILRNYPKKELKQKLSLG